MCEIREYIKKNLNVKVSCEGSKVKVEILLEGKVITSSKDYVVIDSLSKEFE